MSTVAKPAGLPMPVVEEVEELPPLEAGDRLDQKTFHERYETMPEHVRAELIEGVVIMPSPAKYRHGRMQAKMLEWLLAYEAATPGVEASDNVTTILGDESEPQPDGCLIIAPGKGGQVKINAAGYLEGSPEFIGEAASATESYDLHSKKRDYERADVREYLVVALRQQRVYWFVRREGKFVELAPGPDGILRSEVFPGLWLDAAALLRQDGARVLEVLQQGLASPDHAAFVTLLASR